jgi:hypothetical protein
MFYYARTREREQMKALKKKAGLFCFAGNFSYLCTRIHIFVL